MIDEGIFKWFSHVERMENERIAKEVYVEVVAHWVGHGEKKKRRGFEVRQPRRIRKGKVIEGERDGMEGGGER